MNNTDELLEILAIGLDPQTMEAIKSAFKETGIKYKVSFLRNVSEIENHAKKNVKAVFFFSNRQSSKTIDEIRKIHQFITQSSIILISPRPDYHSIVSGFRAGLFDYVTLPIDKSEIRTVLYRIKIHGAIHSGQWNPERAVLHLFSRPENFSSIQDISIGFRQYLNLFFNIDKEIEYSSDDKLLKTLKRRLDYTDHQIKRIKRFLIDEMGLVFGLRFFGGKFYFLVKRGDGKLTYYVAKNKTQYSIKEILSDYLQNVLKTSISIIVEARKRDQILLLSLTDEITGLFNQRKLLEDIDFYMMRFQMEKIGFSLLFVDIDFFKNVNDQYGHVIGSQLLKQMSAVLKEQLRTTDLVYRYGGDEFIVLLPRTEVDIAKKIALRISESVKSQIFKIDHVENYKLSLSIGVASFPQDAHSAKSIIEFADKMMYMSKKSGRGKVFHVNEVVGEE